MAVNAAILAQEDWNGLPDDVKKFVGERGAQGALSLFWDRTATFESLMHSLHAPRKAPMKERVRSIICREFKIELEKLTYTVEKAGLAEVIWLERNEIRSDGIDELAKFLEKRVNLRSLSLKRNYIGDGGAERLGAMLGSWKNKSLETLALGFCNISGRGAQAICTAVLKMPTAMTLTSLDFTANFLKHEGAKALAVAVQDLRFLKSVRAGSNSIEDEGAVALAKAALESRSLTTLDLECNHLTDAAVKELAGAIGQNCPLVDLKLSGNAIGPHGAMFLSQAARSSTALTRLDLAGNALGDVGAEHVAGLLRFATCLRELNLSDNGIGQAGAAYIANAYASNTTLVLMDLDMNAVPAVQVERFKDAVRARGHVGVLRLANHAFGALRDRVKEEEVLVVPAKIALSESARASKKAPGQSGEEEPGPGSRARQRSSLDTGNVKLRPVEKKEEKRKLSGPLLQLFRRWNGSEGQQKGSKKSKSMDLKEFMEMMKGMALVPGKLTRGKVQEIFRAANKAGGGIGGQDGDSAEMDDDEFDFAMNKLATLLETSLEELCELGLSDEAKTRAAGTDRKQVNAAGNVLPDPGAPLEEVFFHFAAGAGQSKKRAASMDGKEFSLLLEHLKLIPLKGEVQGGNQVSKTVAMACFTAAKKMSADSSELNWTAFQFAMKKLAKHAGIPYTELHLERTPTSKEEKRKLSGPLLQLFRRWNGSEGQQKGSKKSKSMDLKEFMEMMKGMALVPGKLTRGKVQEIFRAANKAGGGIGGQDGDSAEMDDDEFDFAMNKLATLLETSLEELCELGLSDEAKARAAGTGKG